MIIASCNIVVNMQYHILFIFITCSIKASGKQGDLHRNVETGISLFFCMLKWVVHTKRKI